MQAVNSQNNLIVHFLGTVKLIWQGRAVSDFATQKVLGLFCYLLDNRGIEISRDKLMTMFWGESPESQARYNLRYALWNIRKLFKENDDDIDPLLSTRSTCQINPEFRVQIDSEDFTKLVSNANIRTFATFEAIIAKYQGPFLEGFTLRNLPEWEEWLYHRREEFVKKYLEAIVELGNLYLAANKPANAIDTFMRGLTVANDLEPAHIGIIRAYNMQGKNSAAIRQYNYYVTVMKREHNLPPQPEAVKIIDEIRRGEPTQPPPIEAGGSTKPPPEPELEPIEEPVIPELVTQPTTDYSVAAPESSPFVGRVQELSTLAQLQQQIIAGEGQALIISGEMGIGKTRLLNRFFEQLPANFVVAITETQEISSTQPLDLFDRLFDAMRNDKRISEEARQELHELGKQLRKPAEPEGSTAEAAQLDAWRRWIVNVARTTPIAIAIDDLHWASEAVLRFFAALAQEVRRVPLLLIGVFRTFEKTTEDAIAASLISIARTGRLWRIELTELSDNETLQLISTKAARAAETMPQQELVKLSKFSHGVPLYAVELANSLEEGRIELLESPLLENLPAFEASSKVTPPLLVKITNLRMGKLPTEQIELLKTAALLIGDFGLPILQTLSKLDSDSLEEALVNLEFRNFLHHFEHNGQLLFAFNHQLIKLAITELIPDLERRRHFKAIIQAIHNSGEQCSSDALAYYLYHADERVEATTPLLESARRWYAVGDQQRALEYSKIAERIAQEHLTTDPNRMAVVILAHANFLVELGMLKPAIDLFNDLISKMESSGEKGAWQARRDQLRELLKIAAPKPQPAIAQLVWVTTKRSLANVKLLQGDREGASQLLGEAEKILEAIPDNPEAIREAGLTLQVKAKIRLAGNDYTEAVQLLENSLELLKREGVGREISETMRLLATAYSKLKRNDKTREWLEACCTKAREIGGDEEVICLHELGLLAAESLKDSDRAEVLLRDAVAAAMKGNKPHAKLAFIQIDYAQVLVKLNKKDDARTQLILSEELLLDSENYEALAKIKQLRAKL
ncbi:MAG: AAA family ATPase [bacterium]|nr:AAA family ATPase [bacterium]